MEVGVEASLAAVAAEQEENGTALCSLRNPCQEGSWRKPHQALHRRTRRR